MKPISKEIFVERATAKHSGKYSYEKVVMGKSTDKVTIVCPVHGDFQQSAVEHMVGSGCRKCKYENHKHKTGVDFSEFMVRAKNKHGAKYDYSLVKYVDYNTLVKIVCPVHGVFEQTPKNHILHECNKCGITTRSNNKKLTQSQVITEFVKVHGDKYDYSNVKYVTSKEKLCITCKVHGEFYQTYHSHKNGNGCPQCASLANAESKKYTFSDFLKKAIAVHGNKYDYSKTRDSFSPNKILITCKKHGDFWQERTGHLSGNGCPSCAVKESKPEKELLEFTKQFFVDSEWRVKGIIGKKELDVYIPSKRFAIEFNGLVFHSDHPTFADNPIRRHKNKTDACKAKGIHLFHLYEDDWNFRQDTVKHTIKHLLGVSDKTVYARKTVIKQHKLAEVKEFYNKYHMQGAPYQGSLVYALYDQDEMVACMTFSKPSSERGNTEDGRYELLRYACKYSVVGGASKLFKHFLKEHKPNSVVSYSDDSMFSGKMYEVLGFKETGKVNPDYKVIDGKIRRHKSAFRRSELIKRLGDKFDPELSERENCHNNGLYRIYNSGLTKWEWKQNT